MATKTYTAIPAPLPQDIIVTDLGRGRLSVATAKRDEAMVDYLRGLGSKWNRDTRAWEVPGTKRDCMIKKLEAMAADIVTKAEAAAMLKEEAWAMGPRYKEAVEGLRCASATVRESKISHDGVKWTTYRDAYITVRLPYSEEGVTLIRAVPGAKWIQSEKVWRVMPANEAELAKVAEVCRKIDTIMDAAHAEKQAMRAAEQAARDEERRKLENRRVLIAAGERRVGETFRFGDRVLVVTDLGKIWMLRSEDACIYGRMPEDQDVRYAYVREASAQEIAVFEASEAAEVKAREERKAVIEAFRAVEQEVSASSTYEHPLPEADREALQTGDIIWHQHAHLAIYGGGTEWVATDGRLWRIDGNGADGDDWSRNNFRSGVARWILRQDAYVEALRAMAAG